MYRKGILEQNPNPRIFKLEPRRLTLESIKEDHPGAMEVKPLEVHFIKCQ
jgi:hypothetical protein